jgi:hypothetical protein
VAAYPSYQAFPGPAPTVISPPPVLIAVADPVPQRRLSVAFRLLLAVPHAFVLYWLAIAACFVGFLGWWGALFTGRLPQFAASYLSGYLRWSTRVSAYHLLLTDVYPPFAFEDDPAYPVRVAIPEAQRLNRAAVFFRYFLALPVVLLAGIVAFGAGTLMAFIAWLVTLITGQLPTSFHLAFVAVARYQARVYGYYFMLTPAYPGGLYGDKPRAVAWADALPASPAAGFGTPAPDAGEWGSRTPGYGTPGGYDPAGYGTPGGYGPAGYGAPGYGVPTPYDPSAPGYGAPAGYGAPGWPGARPVFQPATWLLPLTSAAKRLLTVFVVLGAVLLVCYVAFYSVFVGRVVTNVDSTATASTALHQLNTADTALSNEVASAEQATASCDQNLTCITQQDRKLASDFSTFSTELGNISVPPGALADQAQLGTVTDLAAQNLTQLSKAPTHAQYQSTMTSTGLVQTLNDWDQAVDRLGEKLQSY